MIDRHAAVTKSYLIPGWMWPAELCWLYDTFQHSMSHIEVGTFCGKSLFASCGGMSDGAAVYTIEPLLAGGLCPSTEWQLTTLRATIAAISGPTVQHLQCTSIEAAFRLKKMAVKDIDSVFIDGSHEYADVRADIEMWVPFVRKGGTMSGHDYWPKDAGVMDAVNESFQQFTIVPETRIWRATL